MAAKASAVTRRSIVALLEFPGMGWIILRRIARRQRRQSLYRQIRVTQDW
jgi:hypothetical protein